MSSLKVAFIKANWHSDIVSQALVGFQQEMESQHVSCDVQSLDVPGAFEMPLLAQRLAKVAAMMPSSAPRWWLTAASTAMILLPGRWSAV